MDFEQARARAEAAREAAERARRLDELLAQCRAQGYVAIADEAVEYVAPDAADVAERLDGVPAWARYTVRLASGAVYQEGGTRRVLYCSPAEARARVAARADALLGDDANLWTRLERLHRATPEASEWSPYGVIARDPRRLERLRAGVLARARDPRETGPIYLERHLLALAELGLLPDELHRLGRKTALAPSEVARVRAETAAAAKGARESRVDRLVAERMQQGSVVLDNAAVTPIRRGDARVVEVVEDEPGPLGLTLLLDSGSIYQEAGARRRLIAPAAEARQALAGAADRLIEAHDDVRVLLEMLTRALRSQDAWSVDHAIGQDATRLARLKARILERFAASAETVRIRNGEHLARLAELGIGADALRRTAGAPPLGDGDLQAMAAAAYRSETERRGRLDRLIEERLRLGNVVLEDEAVDYLPPDHPTVQEVLADAPPWASRTLILQGGGIYHEGGKRRMLYCSVEEASQRIAVAADRIVDDPALDLRHALMLLVRCRQDRREWSVFGFVGRDARRLGRLTERVLAMARDPERHEAVTARSYLELLADLGLEDEHVRRLAGERQRRPKPTPAAANAAALAAAAAAAVSAAAHAARFGRHEAQARASGFVELTAESVAYVPDDDPRIVERLNGTPDEPFRFTAILADGSLYREGGVQRTLLLPAEAVEGYLAAQAERLLESDNLFGLIETALAVREPGTRPSLWTWLAAAPERIERLHARIRAAAAEAPVRVTRERQRELLRSIGVPEDTLERLRRG